MNGEQGTESPTGARPGRFWILLALIVAGGALLVGIIGLATKEPSNEYVRVEGTTDAQRIFGGVRQLGDRLGFGDAPVQIQYFTDVQSIPGRENFLAVVPELVETEVRNGDVQMLFRNRSLTRNPTQISFYGVEAAAAQDAGWNFAYLMVRNFDLAEEAGRIDEELLSDLAEGVERLELPIWKRDFERGIEPDSATTRRLEEYDKIAIDLGLRAEPAMVVAGPSGTEVLQDSPGLDRVRTAIEAVR